MNIKMNPRNWICPYCGENNEYKKGKIHYCEKVNKEIGIYYFDNNSYLSLTPSSWICPYCGKNHEYKGKPLKNYMEQPLILRCEYMKSSRIEVLVKKRELQLYIKGPCKLIPDFSESVKFGFCLIKRQNAGFLNTPPEYGDTWPTLFGCFKGHCPDYRCGFASSAWKYHIHHNDVTYEVMFGFQYDNLSQETYKY